MHEVFLNARNEPIVMKMIMRKVVCGKMDFQSLIIFPMLVNTSDRYI